MKKFSEANAGALNNYIADGSTLLGYMIEK